MSSIENTIHKFQERDVYLWGAAQTGIGILAALQRLSLSPKGFIDKRKNELGKSVKGLPVFLPQEIVKKNSTPKPFIINTTTLHENAVAEYCEQFEFKKNVDYISYSDICPFDYQVIVSSSCNLRCISCPIGNRPDDLHKGFMSAKTYTDVLEKIISENPFISVVQLFNWGEPFLNPELAEIISVTNKRNVLCSLSSNMSFERDFQDVIAAGPSVLRVSLSGNAETYRHTHTGGNWDTVLANLKTLCSLRKKLNPLLTVEIAYHVYASTTETDLAFIEQLCNKYSFVFRPHLAALLPLDNISDIIDQKELSAAAKKTSKLLAIPVSDALIMAVSEQTFDCSFQRTVCIESDLSVKQCGLWIYPENNTTADNFLKTPLSEIAAKKRKHPLCVECKKKSLHRYCSINTNISSAKQVSK